MLAFHRTTAPLRAVSSGTPAERALPGAIETATDDGTDRTAAGPDAV